MFPDYLSLVTIIKQKILSQSGCWKVKDEQSKYWNISGNFRFLSTTAILYVFLNEQEIYSKYDAKFIVNYSNIKKYWIEVKY